MSLKEEIASRLHGRVVVFGIGNPERGDDGAGSAVARSVEARNGIRVFDAQDVPENYLGPIVAARPDTVMLIDSVDMGAPPGSITILTKNDLAGYWPSTHRIPLCLLMNYLERETGADVFLAGIQPAHLEFGRPMCETIRRAAGELAAIIDHAVATQQHEPALSEAPECGLWTRMRYVLHGSASSG
ncbi:MAG: hydrogenase 3 maturation endopeptidase HyCI [Acidobacteriota bacterium]